MTIIKEDLVKSKKAQDKPIKIQTAEGWKRKQEQLLRDKHAEEIKDRRKAI